MPTGANLMDELGWRSSMMYHTTVDTVSETTGTKTTLMPPPTRRPGGPRRRRGDYSEGPFFKGEPLVGPGGLFKKIREHARSPQEAGRIFERLVKTFLSEDPLFKERFSQVWLWSGLLC
jgi:hypothetical protein